MPLPGRVRAAVALVLAATLVAYLPALRNGFVWDDRQYILENARVAGGLTAEGVRWAVTSLEAGNWHPLTWISHMIDTELFGRSPRGPHAVNVVLHLANTALLFLLLHRLTAAPWRSALAAALFGMHPLRVESVAWAAERKDVLAAAFGLLAACAYVPYARRPGVGRYLAVAGLYLLALAAKPMLVTLPFLLLFLDLWPLGRIGPAQSAPAAARLALVEKAPLLVLSAAASTLAYIAQRSAGGVVGLSENPPVYRLGNAVASSVAYLRMAAWPAGLSAFYVHPGADLPPAKVVAGIVVLGAATAAALLLRRRAPWCLVGWLWFLGALVPVLGFVQVGFQGMADRYTYLPAAGLFVCAAWGVGGPALRRRRWRPHFALLAATALIAFAALTAAQVVVWRDDVTLFTHAARVVRGNWYAHYNLGAHYQDLGRLEEAERHYREAIRSRRPYERALNNLGVLLAGRGLSAEAEALFLAAIRRRPDYANAYSNLAGEYRRQGRAGEAEAMYRTALRLKPAAAEFHFNLGALLLSRGRPAEAEERFAEALRLSPGDADARRGLALSRARRGVEAE